MRVLFIAALLLFSELAAATPKKGLGMWRFPGTKAAEADASWYYDWKPYPLYGATDNFIPMIWGRRDWNNAAFEAVKDSAAPAVLAINEPDHTDQSNMSVGEALKYWPRLMAAAEGKRIGSPAVASDYKWLDSFMAQAKEKGYRVDFICVHTYPDISNPEDAAKKTADLLTWIHNRYGLPIWLTEFGASSSWGHARQNLVDRFVPALLADLEAMDFVERYAWYTDSAGGDFAVSQIFDGRGNLTRTGLDYKNSPE